MNEEGAEDEDGAQHQHLGDDAAALRYCGRKARKKIATFGLVTLMTMPRIYGGSGEF
ncbi:hypothetical protein [Mesorhizobium sp. M4B.F.Ca.ET.049.02.1.2]|uniref:hypothetical protein n=1 Tax=Mesorhizobium sp. M4B.F.Ca.ET.049.02.1.2 TaxID=2496752 RepID=UPI00167B4E4F|nr:hypothetical protein [Mesorhizobium sp. M4B.F.Ca.ET.049.02.1.2]